MSAHRTAAAVVGLLLAATSLTACGSETGPAQQTTTSTGVTTVAAPATTPAATTSATTTPGETMSPTLDPSSGVTEGAGKAAPRTVTGTVTAGVEAGCLVLTTEDGEHLQPLGAELQDGDRVTVEGVDATGVMTTCMQGKPFRVLRVVSRG